MKVKDLMSTQVISVNPSTSVTETAKIMEKHDVGSVPVCEKQGVVGIVTDRDIILRNIAKGMDPGATSVREIMTEDVFTVSPDMDVDDATDLMATQQIRRLPVVENNKLVGMLALGDIAIEEDYDFEAGEALTEISEND